MNQNERIVAVTGAFGYSGRHIAQRLLDAGYRVRTLTGSPDRENPFGGRLDVYPLAFDQPRQLAESLRGVRVLINTYWVRFDHANFSHAQAVRNTRILFDAARLAGVGRIVHVSITNPSADSPLPYFRGKAELEAALRETRVNHSILRPAVLFGGQDILVNNIAWALRRFAWFAVFGDGRYRLQPIHVSDFAELALREAEAAGNRTVEAIGPETFSYRELVEMIGRAIGHPRRLVSVSPRAGYLLGRAIGMWQRDEFITREEIAGLMEERLYVDAPSAGTIRLSNWAKSEAGTLGQRYASELRRRRDRRATY